MRQYVFRVLVAALVLPAGAASEGTAMPQRTTQVTVSYESRSPVTLHEPVFIDFSVQNRLSEEIRLDLGDDYKTNFVFRIIGPDGAAKRVRAKVHGGLSLIGRTSVPPMGRYSQEFLLSELYYFDKPGSYRIEAALDSPVRKRNGASIRVATRRAIKIDMLPRNPSVLARKCEDLAITVERRTSFSEARDAALTLSYVIDPVSVPYLERILVLEEWGDFGLAGLARVADPASIKILRSAAESGSQPRRSLATGMLETIQKGERDPLKRGKITIID